MYQLTSCLEQNSARTMAHPIQATSGYCYAPVRSDVTSILWILHVLPPLHPSSRSVEVLRLDGMPEIHALRPVPHIIEGGSRSFQARGDALES